MRSREHNGLARLGRSNWSHPVTRHVLIIDDDPDIRDVVQCSLELTANWRVSQAASGLEGVRLAQELQPDGILLDLMMPGMDGTATARALSADGSRVPVVLLTAKHVDDAFVAAIPGVTATLAKPFDPLTLHAQIAVAFGWCAPC